MRKILLLFLLALLTLAPAANAQDEAHHSREIARIGRSIPNPQSLQWRPDGQIAARRVGESVRLYDTNYDEVAILGLPEEYKIGWSKTAWSPDSRFLALLSGTQDWEFERVVQLWSIDEFGKPTKKLFELATDSFTIGWKPDSTQLALRGNVYDAFTGDLIFSHKHAAAIYDEATREWLYPDRDRVGYEPYWSPDGLRFVAVSYFYPGSSAHIYGIFDANTDELLVEMKESRIDPSFPSFVWDPDGGKVTDGIRTWDTHTGELLAKLPDDDIASYFAEFGAYYAVWSADGESVITLFRNRIAIGYATSYLDRWDATTGEILYKRTFWHNLKDLRWDNGILKARTFEGYNLTIDADSGVITTVEDTIHAIDPDSLVWSPDSTKLISLSGGTPSFPMQMWDVASILDGNAAQPLWTVNDDWFLYETEAEKYPPTDAKVLWSQENDAIITVSQTYWIGRNFHSVEEWAAATGQSQGRLYWAEGDWQEPPIAEPNPDFTQFALTYSLSERDNQLDVIDAATKETIVTLQGEKLTAALWSPDGSMLATYDIRGESPISQIWDMANEPGRLIYTFESGGDRAAWNPDGRFIALLGEKLLVANPLTGEIYMEFPITSGWEQPIWSPDSRYVVVASGGDLSFFDMTTGNLKEMARLDSSISALAWSPDGRMLALGMSDGTIRIWDVADLMEQ